jgi:hypothetical protein
VIHLASFGWTLKSMRAEPNTLGDRAVPLPPGSPRIFMPAAISDQKVHTGKDEKTAIS